MRHRWYYCYQQSPLVCNFQPTKGNNAKGRVTFRTVWIHGRCLTHVRAKISGLTPNTKQGWHIHKYGDIVAESGASTGGHFSTPSGRQLRHGLPNDRERHWGDLGNLNVRNDGMAWVSMFDRVIRLNDIIGRGMIIHASEDQGSSQQPSGASGPRVAQCVIGIANPKNLE